MKRQRIKTASFFALSIFLLAQSSRADGFLPKNFSGLKSFIQEKKIQSIDQLLPQLSKDYLSSYVLMRKTRSLQAASDSNPRVILFGAEARFMMAFGTDPKNSAHNLLEIIEFNDTEKKFEFYSIKFPPSPEKPIQFSDKNPQKCRSCHGGDDPRPNWEHYPFWDGAFGEHHHGYKDNYLSKNETYLQKFLSGKKTNGRLASLENPKSPTPIEKFVKDKFVPVPFEEWGDEQFYKAFSDLNGGLTQRLAVLNSERIARMLDQHPKLKYASLAIINNCVPDLKTLNQFLPESHRLHEEIVHPDFTGMPDKNSSLLASLFYSQGIDISHWFMNFKIQLNTRTHPIKNPKRFGTATPSYDRQILNAPIVKTMKDHDLATLFYQAQGTYSGVSYAEADLPQSPGLKALACQKLQTLSIRAMSASDSTDCNSLPSVLSAEQKAQFQSYFDILRNDKE